MKTYQLMIGNIVLVKDKPVRVTELFGDSVTVKGENNKLETVLIEECKPIIISTKWLILFGFQPLTRHHKKYTPYEKNGLEYHGGGFFYYCGEEVLVDELIYIHQLQNLYYALTHKHLKDISN